MSKILMVTERYFPIWGGAENQLRQLAQLLGGYDLGVDVVTRRWKKSMPPFESVDGISVRRIGIPGEGPLATLLFALGLFVHLLRNKSKYSVVHSHGAANLGALLALAASFTGIPAVSKIATAGRIPRMQERFVGRLILGLLKQADVIVCMSEEIYTELKAIGVQKEKIRHIQNGVDPVRFKPLNQKFRIRWRREAGLPEDAILVVFSGRLVSRKGVDTLIDAWKLIEHSGVNAHLYLLGSGEDQPDSVEKDLRACVVSSELRHIYFEGNVSAPEEYLNVADIFVFPSRREGFPNALLEAMSAGLAVVASRVGGNEDLILEGRTGLLCEVDDSDCMAESLRRLISNPDLRDRMGKQARTHVLENNSIRQITSLYCALYSELSGDCDAV